MPSPSHPILTWPTILFAFGFCFIAIAICPFHPFSSTTTKIQVGFSVLYTLCHSKLILNSWFLCLSLFLFTTSNALLAEYVAINTKILDFEHAPDKLDPLLFGQVPVFILLAWYSTIYQGFILSQYIIGFDKKKASFWKIIGISTVAGYITASWDLAVDPYFVHHKVFTYFYPKETSSLPLFFGVPLHNFLGWFLLSFSANVFMRYLMVWVPSSGSHEVENTHSGNKKLLFLVQVIIFLCSGLQFTLSSEGTTTETRLIAFYTCTFPSIIALCTYPQSNNSGDDNQLTSKRR